MKLVLTKEQIQLLESLGDKAFGRLYEGSEEFKIKGTFVRNPDFPNWFEHKPENLDQIVEYVHKYAELYKKGEHKGQIASPENFFKLLF